MEEDEEEDLYDETEQSKVKKAKKLLLQQKVKERQLGAETYESLRLKYEEWSKELDQVENQLKLTSTPVIKAAKTDGEGEKTSGGEGEEKTDGEGEKTSGGENDEEIDSLEMFMKQELTDDSNRIEVKIEKSRLKMKIKELQKKMTNCEKLMKIACPTHIPSFNVQSSGSRQKSMEKISVRSSSSVQQSTGDEKLINKGAISEEIKPVQSSSKFQMKIIPKSLSSSKYLWKIRHLKVSRMKGQRMKVPRMKGQRMKELDLRDLRLPKPKVVKVSNVSRRRKRTLHK